MADLQTYNQLTLEEILNTYRVLVFQDRSEDNLPSKTYTTEIQILAAKILSFITVNNIPNTFTTDTELAQAIALITPGSIGAQAINARLTEIINAFNFAANGQYLRKKLDGSGIDYGTPSGGGLGGGIELTDLSANSPINYNNSTGLFSFTESALSSNIARLLDITTAINNHLAASDPHPTYTTTLELNNALSAKENIGVAAALVASVTLASLGGVSTTDSRLLDQRTPLNFSVTNAKVANNANIDWTKISKIGALPEDVGADPVGTASALVAAIPLASISVAGLMSTTDKTKLNSVASGATANATNEQLRDRLTHTGEQTIDTITGLVAALNAKQTLNSNLTALANLINQTTFGRNLLTLNNQNELLNAAGAQTALTFNSPLVVTANVVSLNEATISTPGSLSAADKLKIYKLTNHQILTDAATVSWNVNNGLDAKVTLAGNRTLAITNAVAGDVGVLNVNQDTTGSRTLTLPTGSLAVGGLSTIVLSIAASSKDVLSFRYDGTNYFWTLSKGFAA